MKKQNRTLQTRLMALFLVLICVLGLLPTSAFAAADTITLKEFGHSGVAYQSAALGRCTLHEMSFANGNKITTGFCGTKGGGMGTSLQGQTWGNKTAISDPTVEIMMAYYYAHSTGVFTDEAKALGVNDVWSEGYRWYMNAWTQACIWRYQQGSMNDPVVACAEEFMAVYNSLEGTHYTSIDDQLDGKSFRDRTQYILDVGRQGVWGKCHVYEYKFTGAGSANHPASSVQKIILGDLEVEQITEEEYAIIIKKVDATNPSKSLPGAGFHIESENGTYSKDVITGENGTYRIGGLSAGTYAVTETAPPPGGYEIDSVAPQYVVLPSNNNKTVTVTFRDTTTITGEGSIRKVDSDNPSKGLAGAVIKITGVDNSFVGTYTTKEGGYLTDVPWDTMPIGSYVAEEVTPPEGFSLSPDASKVKQSFHWDGKSDVSLVFENDSKVKIRLLKLDDSNHPLPGCVFNIIKDGQIIGTEATKEDGSITVTDVTEGLFAFVEVSAPAPYARLLEPVFAYVDQVTTNGGGTVTVTAADKKLPNLTILKRDAQTGEVIPETHFEIKGIHRGYHNDVVTGPDGKAVLTGIPVDSYEVTEKSVKDPYVVGDNPTQTIWLGPGDSKELVFDNLKQPLLKISKVEKGTNPLVYVPNTNFLIEGVDSDFRHDVTTGPDGTVELRVVPGSYKITERSVPEPYCLPEDEEDRVQVISLNPGDEKEVRFENQKKPLLTLKKIDADSGAVIPNTVLTVKALDGTYQDDWTTGQDGTVSLRVNPGVYEVTEKSVPSPYYLPDKDADRTQTITLEPGDEQTLIFRNRKAPELTIFKENSITGEPIEHAKFKVVYTSNGEAAEAPATIDYGEVFTDARGEIRVHELGKRLYPGEFTITELEPADGFQLKEPITQTVIIHGNESKIARFQNTPLSALVVWKYDSVTSAPVEGAIFQVRYMSGTSGSGGTVIGTYKTGPGGSFTINRLKAGAYLVEELASDGDHVMDTAPQTAYISGKEQDVVQLYFGNSPKGSLLLKKISASDHSPLSDCEFFITDSHGTMLGDANGKFVTDSAGTILISNIDPGTTIVARETRAKDGYLLDDVPQTATIKAGQTVSLEFRNQPKGSVTLYKFSSLDRRTPLEGVGFKITHANGKVVDNIGGKLSSNGIYYTDSEGQINISGVTGTLVFTEISTIPGYLIDENRKSQTIVVNPDDHQSVYFYNIPETTLIIEKYLETEAGNQPLKGVTFLVTDSSGAVVGNSNGEFISGEDGRIVIDGVAPGTTVIAREIKTPDGVVLDSTPKTIKIGDTGGKDANILRFYNKETGYLVVRKLDKISKEPLSGVEFELTYAQGGYVDDNFGHLSSKGRFKTNDAGEVRVPVVGTVVVKELTPCPGYVIDKDTQIQTVTVNPADTQTIVVYNEPLCSLTLSKKDAITGKPVPNTEFTLKDGNGNILGKYVTGSDGTVTVTGLIPGSTIVVVETKVPSGYVLDSTPHTIIVRNGTGNSVVTGGGSSGGAVNGGTSGGTSSGGGNDLTIENYPKVTLTIEKYLETESGEKPLKGVTFLLTDQTGAVVGSSNGEFTSDENGRIVIPNLEPGTTVTAKEIKVPDGVVLDSSPKSILIKKGEQSQTLRVVNKATGYLVIKKLDKLTSKPLAGVQFKLSYASGEYVDDNYGHLSSLGLYTTDQNGEIRVPVVGTVVVEETKTLPGYTIDPGTQRQVVTVNPADTQTITVYNTPDTNLTIQKYIEDPDAPGTGDEPLAGVTFLVTDSAGTPLGPNNGEYVTDKNGQIRLSVAPGTTITAKEIKVPSGEFVLDGTPQSILIKEGEGQTLTFYNKRVGGLELIKVSASDETKRIPNTTFEIRKMDGALVETVTTDSTGRVHVDLDAGDYYAVETKAGDGFKLDSTPHYFTVEDNKCTTLTVTNKAFSGILIHKVDSTTKKGIYGVSFLLYDSTNRPIGQYTSDDQGYVYIEDITEAGRYYLKELENEGYITDTQMKTVYVKPGETTLVEWENTPISGQIQITKKSADYNSTNGLPAGTLLEGAVFEIYDKASNLVDTIRSDGRGLAVSRQLPLGRYTIRETKAPANYGVNDTILNAYLEHEGQIVRFEVTNKSMSTGVAITKTGPKEVMAGQPVIYTLSGIANSSNVRLDNFYWRDTLPAEVRLTQIVTGTYNFPGVYKITYRVNGGEPQTLADNLSTQKNYTLAASATALGLASNERVTEIMFVFGQVPGGFAQVEKPKLTCMAISSIASASFVNKADVGGTYNGVWVQAISRWVTTVYGKPVVPKLPRTGY